MEILGNVLEAVVLLGHHSFIFSLLKVFFSPSNPSVWKNVQVKHCLSLNWFSKIHLVTNLLAFKKWFCIVMDSTLQVFLLPRTVLFSDLQIMIHVTCLGYRLNASLDTVVPLNGVFFQVTYLLHEYWKYQVHKYWIFTFWTKSKLHRNAN